MSEEGRGKDQSITDRLPAEFEGFEHRQKGRFQSSPASRQPEARRHHNLSKLSEIKGYEVFRVDSSFLSPGEATKGRTRSPTGTARSSGVRLGLLYFDQSFLLDCYRVVLRSDRYQANRKFGPGCQCTSATISLVFVRRLLLHLFPAPDKTNREARKLERRRYF